MQARPSLDLEKAKKKLEESKGKIPKMPHYSEQQLKEVQHSKLVRLMLMLQDENDRLRSEMEKTKMRLSIADKKGEQVSQLKLSIKGNQEIMEQAKAALREG